MTDRAGLDVITHPNHRRKDIAGAVLEKLTSFLDERGRASFLIDGSGAPGLYERAGFRAVEAESGERIMYREATLEERVPSIDSSSPPLPIRKLKLE